MARASNQQMVIYKILYVFNKYLKALNCASPKRSRRPKLQNELTYLSDIKAVINSEAAEFGMFLPQFPELGAGAGGDGS